MQDRPHKAADFIKAKLGGPSADDYERAVAENRRLQADLQKARLEIEELKAKLDGAAAPPPSESTAA